MTILHRRLIYVFFIIIFLVTAPLIILYTMGYRYNFTKGRVQKTGIIRITSVPRGADIYLNGVKYETGQTPARIEKLLPGDYEIKLAKDGYYDWQKKLPVYENGTTFAEKIILWKKSTSAEISTTTVSSWLISPDGNIIAAADDLGAVNLLDINSGIFGEISGGIFETIAEISGYDSFELLSFSPSSRYLLAQAGKKGKISYYLIDTLAKESKKLPGQDYLSLKWEAANDNLYGLDKTGLWSISLSSLKSSAAVKGLAADDFYLSGKNLYLLSAGALSRRTLESAASANIEKINCPDCAIKEVKNNRLIARNSSGKILIVDLDRKIKTIEASAKNIDWLNSGSLLFSNDHEIYIYELAKNSPELITRLGSPITSAIWHPNGRHLIFSTDNKIKIIELDNRELRNIIEISDSAAAFLTIDRAGNNLYYAVDKTGIFKLNIQ